MTTDSHPHKPELLAPAGSLEAFFAALEFGADAVYVGLKEFSARAKAKNVNREELERMVAFAHAQERQVFLTLNTLVKENELSLLIDTLAFVESIGIDAIILQDLGVWRLARRHFPGLQLHASTQLTIHNTAGVKMAERLGFSRVVLARELSLEEIAAIHRHTRLDLEHFVHGAHCFSLSGQCSFSSWLGGMSGNRGRCAQPCRRRYHHKGKDGYYFSPNDLSAIDLLPELTAAGVRSLKIEGRMKSAEYVANVVQAYRLALDATAAERAEVLVAARDLLKESFGRTPTRGFLPSGTPTDMVNPGLHGATGQMIGRVARSRRGRLDITPGQSLHLGDRLRVQPASDKPGTAFTVREMFRGKAPVTRANAGEQVSLGAPPDKSFQAGDLVFKVSSGKAFTLSQTACRRRLESVAPGQERLTLAVGMPTPERLAVTASCGSINLHREFTVESFPATDRPLSEAVLAKVFAKTGTSPFSLGEMTCGELPAVVIPPSRLNALRRELYGELTEMLEDRRQAARTEHRRAAMADLAPVREPRGAETTLTVAIAHPHDLTLLRDDRVDEVLVPLTPGAKERLEPVRNLAVKQAQRVIWDLPPAIFDLEWDAYRDEIERLLAEGFRRFRLQNIAQFKLFEDTVDLALETGYRLFTTNTQAATAWRELGITAATLYVEDDRDNYARLLKGDVGLAMAITVYANLPMMISRIPLRRIKPDRPVLSDRGEAYRVEQRQGLTTLRPAQDFSLLGHLGELRAMGCSRFIVDLSHLGGRVAENREILNALQQDRPLPDCSTFNYTREMV